MNKQITPLESDLAKYEHELETLKMLKMRLDCVFLARMQTVEEKIAECKKMIKTLSSDSSP